MPEAYFPQLKPSAMLIGLLFATVFVPIAASSSPIRRQNPTTSACRVAASFRFREAAAPGGGGELSSRAPIADAFDLAADEQHYIRCGIGWPWKVLDAVLPWGGKTCRGFVF